MKNKYKNRKEYQITENISSQLNIQITNAYPLNQYLNGSDFDKWNY